jgi:UDP-N-acetylglucosamine acyltransferase
VHDTNVICGLNVVGLRRHGYDSPARLELRKTYHELFRSHKKLSEALVTAKELYKSEGARLMIEFVESSKRGVCAVKSSGAEESESETQE